jgi:predicted nucleotidyltransferase
VRLTDHEVAAIKAAARLTFGPDAVVRLFGSRVDDTRRGGDIDLHVETPAKIDFWRSKSDFLDRLFARIDEQRVDLIATTRGEDPVPIAQIAYRDGIVL